MSLVLGPLSKVPEEYPGEREFLARGGAGTLPEHQKCSQSVPALWLQEHRRRSVHCLVFWPDSFALRLALVIKTLGLMAGSILAARSLSINAYTLPHPLRIRGSATPDIGGGGACL